MKRDRAKSGVWFLLLAAAALTPPHRAAAQSPPVPFGPVTIVAGFAPGGGDENTGSARNAASRLQPQPGYDQTARLFARHLGGFLPGNPAVAVRHMPGAGSIKAAGYIANEAARDGNILGVISAAALLAPVLGNEDAGYSLSSFAFVGGRSTDEYVCAADGSSGIETLDDIKSREYAFGASAPGRRPHTHALLLQQLTSAPLRIVSGYRDTNEMMLALRRGEVSALCGLSFEIFRAGLPGWISSGRLKPLMRLSPPASEKLRAIPRAQDIARQEKASPELIQALDFMALEGTIAWTLVAPAQIPASRLMILRDAFTQMQKDRNYLREAGRRNLEIDAVSIESIETAIDLIANTSPAVLAVVKKLNSQP